MSEMPKAYDFKTTEKRLYQWWEENGWFKPEARGADAKPFTISIPPPNVTGELHMGHAMFVALEDLMIRRARRQGFAGTYHRLGMSRLLLMVVALYYDALFGMMSGACTISTPLASAAKKGDFNSRIEIQTKCWTRYPSIFHLWGNENNRLLARV